MVVSFVSAGGEAGSRVIVSGRETSSGGRIEFRSPINLISFEESDFRNTLNVEQRFKSSDVT